MIVAKADTIAVPILQGNQRTKYRRPTDGLSADDESNLFCAQKEIFHELGQSYMHRHDQGGRVSQQQPRWVQTTHASGGGSAAAFGEGATGGGASAAASAAPAQHHAASASAIPRKSSYGGNPGPRPGGGGGGGF